MNKYNYETYEGFSIKGCDRTILKDTRGVKRSKTLFIETIMKDQVESGYKPLYSLSPDEKHGLPSAYQIFINSATEAEAALKLVGSMPHWRALLQKEWFLFGDIERILGFEGIEIWRQDFKEIKKAEAIKRLEVLASEGNVAALKQLLVEAEKITKPNLTPKQRVKAVADPRDTVLDLALKQRR